MCACGWGSLPADALHRSRQCPVLVECSDLVRRIVQKTVASELEDYELDKSTNFDRKTDTGLENFTRARLFADVLVASLPSRG